MGFNKINNRLNGLNPLSYMGENAYQPSEFVTDTRAPTTNDSRNFAIGCFWLDTETNTAYILVDLTEGIATWTPFTGTGNAITINTDTGSATPNMGVLNILGGSNLNTTGSGNTVTVNMDNSISLSGSVSAGTTITAGTGLTVSSFTAGAVQSDGSGNFSSSTLGVPLGGTDKTSFTPYAVICAGTTGTGALQNVVGVGNAGQVLTSNGAGGLPSWQDGGGGGSGSGSLVFLAEQTAVGDTFLDFVSEVTSTYNEYMILLENIAPTGTNKNFIVQLSTDGGSTWLNTDYGNINPSVDNGIVLQENGGGQNPQTVMNSICTLYNVTSGSGWVATASSTGSGTVFNVITTTVLNTSSGGFYQNPDIVVNALRFMYEDESVFDGTVKLYGFSTIPGGSTGGTIITTYTSSDTWTKNANTKFITVYGWGGGSGAGSGRRGVSTASGGGAGGASGAVFYMEFLGANIGATSTVTIGAGGAGGVPQTVNDTDGNDGASGGVTTFGNLLMSAATGGQGGINGTSNGGSSQVGWSNGNNMSNGGNGGVGTNTAGHTAPVNIGYSYLPIPGGGGGGADSGTPRAGGAGGAVIGGDLTTVLLAGGAAGIESGTIDGGNGNDAASGGAADGFTSGGSGGGGGGGQSSGLVAGNGGDGGFPGGGGGGGGGSLNGTASGAGGAGGAGMVVVIEYL